MTSVYPYVAWWHGEGVHLWGAMGYGAGEVEIDDDEAGVQSSDGTLKAAALGGHVRLLSDNDLIRGGEATTLTLKGEAWAARFDLENNGGLMRGLKIGVNRLRLVLEGEHPHGLPSGAILTPSLELGLRRDGGDGETGAGVEVGGALHYADAASGLTMQVRGSALAAHAGDVEEWNAGGSVRVDPGLKGRGLSFKLALSLGAAESRMNRLGEYRVSSDLASSAETTSAVRLDAELGYGFLVLGGNDVLTPYAGLESSDEGARRYRLGGRLKIGPALSLGLEVERSESDRGYEHGILFKATLR